ncbi:response regulator transcription factor [Pseudomonas sp. Pf153]|uniref:response regulator transcription factor n=1 Tax=Pseudomonas sp. Pf153 TaxID=1699309 RepID=UPI00069F4214|nr:response regulator [Pseudomonas sp. Pf153]
MPISIPLIAVVDDDDALLASIDSLLRSVGYKAQLFACAEDFLASEDVDKTDCLMTDIHMPGISGLELQNKLTNLGYTFPVIFMTAHAEVSVRNQAIDRGAIGFLVKPFNGQAILDCVEDALARSIKNADG